MQAEAEGKTLADREAAARNHPDFLDYISALGTAKAYEMRLRYEVEAIKWRLEMFRTRAADRRTEMRHLGGVT